ncbi:AEC family transporter [Clostridium vincentii]|uniref:Membrane transport protein n=1 Tax=Clostridium vincentii TaxID=52704 RepID=A0A2T0BHR9_9CLOT|nr:Membrane transport protein [Clostridium vincentii]
MIAIENLIISINVVLPLFLIISLGYFFRKINLFDDHTLKVMNNLTFKSFLPILIFFNIYNADLSSGIDFKLIIFAVMSIVSIFLVMTFIIPKIEKDDKRKGVLVQAIFRSNFVLFGLPIAISLFGEEKAGSVSMLIACIIPTFNFLAVISLEMYRGLKIDVKKILKGIITNPLIIGSTVGLFMLATGIKLPNVLESTIGDLSNVATPLALVVLGGSFKFDASQEGMKQLIIGVVGKLIIVPAVFIPISIFLGFRDVELITLLVMFSAPGAVSSFTMAEQMDADGELAGQIVVFGSTFAVFTIFFWIYIVKSLGYF